MAIAEVNSDQSNDLHFWSRMVDQRRESRIDFRTTGHAIPLQETGLEPKKAPTRVWTVDVSTTGALIRSYEPLDCRRVMVEFVMPQLAGSMIEGEIVRSFQEQAIYFDGKERTAYLYGVRFARIISKNALPENFSDQLDMLTKLAPEIIAVDDSGDPDEAFPSTVESPSSLVPLLSTIGLIAVYSTLLFVF